MTIALSFSGLPRIRASAIDSWRKLLNKHECHVYCHVWNTDREAILELINIFNPVACIFEPTRQFDISDYSERLKWADPNKVLSMWTSIHKSMHLVKGSNISYKRVVRARFDVFFDEFDFLDNNGVIIPGKPAEVYEWNNSKYPGWHDLMAYGDLESMLVYAETINAIPKIYNSGSDFYSEFFLSTHLYQKNMQVTHHALNLDVARFD
jgi:hypothetical protein